MTLPVKEQPPKGACHGQPIKGRDILVLLTAAFGVHLWVACLRRTPLGGLPTAYTFGDNLHALV